MASPVAGVPESGLEPTLHPMQGRAWQGLRLGEVGDVRRDEVPFELDRKLAALCHERGPLRAVLARIASRLVLLECLGAPRLCAALRLRGREAGDFGALRSGSGRGRGEAGPAPPPGGRARLRRAGLDEGAPAGASALRRRRSGLDRSRPARHGGGALQGGPQGGSGLRRSGSGRGNNGEKLHLQGALQPQGEFQVARGQRGCPARGGPHASPL